MAQRPILSQMPARQTGHRQRHRQQQEIQDRIRHVGDDGGTGSSGRPSDRIDEDDGADGRHGKTGDETVKEHDRISPLGPFPTGRQHANDRRWVE